MDWWAVAVEEWLPDRRLEREAAQRWADRDRLRRLGGLLETRVLTLTDLAPLLRLLGLDES